jgi:hypothetical protein
MNAQLMIQGNDTEQFYAEDAGEAFMLEILGGA